MKKIRTILFGIISFIFIALITACDNDSGGNKPNNEHVTHNYTIQKFNEAKHWNECSCGEKSDEEEHKWTEWIITKEPTEETTGIKKRECNVCHYNETETLSVLTHTHSYMTQKSNKTKHWKECSCGEKSDEEEHKWTAWNITKEATETTLGSKERECSVCHHKETEIIPKLDHTHQYSTEWTIDKESTCTEAGSKSHHCLGCDERTDITEIPMIDHSYGSWKTTKEPTEETTGLKERECSACHHKETEIIPKLDHTHKYSMEWTIDKEATCTETGSKSHHCLGCDERTDITEIPMIDHSYGSWKTTKEPTEETTGLKERECSACHHKETEIIPKLDHTHKYSMEWTIDKEATCTETGSKSHHCLGCDEKTDITEIPSGHSYVNGICVKCGEEFSTEGLEYEYDSSSDSYSVKGIGTSKDKNIVIASVYNAKPVTSIGKYAFRYCSNLTSIEIPNSVTSIEDSAFYYCSSLTSIVIPDSVKSIGQNAFRYCRSLTSITIPFVGSSLNGTSNTHFGYIFGASSYSSNSFYVPSSLKEVIITGGESIGDRAFYECGNLTSITIGDSVTSIGDSAFYYCSSLTSIEISNSVTSIGDSAFYYCSNLTSVVIPNSVVSIGNSAFSGCSNLINVYYEGSIEDWCNITFSNEYSNPMSYASHYYLRNSNNEWEKVTSIEIPNTITEIGSYQFRGFSNVTSISILDSVTDIGTEAFSGCNNIVKAIMPTTAISSISKSKLQEVIITGGESIGDRAFSTCSNLTSITIGDSVTSIGNDVFYDCGKLTNVYYGGSIEDWCNITFSSYYNSNPMSRASHFYIRNSSNEWEEVTSIEIPNTITEIGYAQFYGFSNVTSIIIPNSVTSIGAYAFDSCYKLAEIYNYSSLNIVKGSSNFGYVGYYAKVIHTQEEKSNLIEKDNYIFIKDNESKYYLISYKGTETGLVLPNDIEGNNYEINHHAFYNCISLTNITIPNSVTSIGAYAFYGCSSLTSIVIPDSVTGIGYDAFSRCSSLTSIVIPNSVTSIEQNAFLGCRNLTSIVIPDSVTSIGTGAFYGCSSLTNVYYEGSIEDWCNITFRYFTSNPMNEASHFYIRNSNNEWEEVTSIEIPNTIIKIGEYQFYGFSNVTSIIIPDSVTSIGEDAFKDCYKLVEIYNYSPLKIDKGSTNFGYVGYYAKVIHTQEEKSDLVEKDSYVFIKDNENKYYLISYKGTDTELVLPADIEGNTYEIYQSAFFGCRNLTSIVIPNGVKSIGSAAFGDCSSLTNVTIENSVTSIGKSAFSGCSGLTSMTIPFVGASLNGTSDTHFGYIFGANSYSNNSSYVPSSLKEVIITGGTSIGNSAFYDCSSLTSVVIPNSVTSIGHGAFFWCSNLQYNEYENGLYLGNVENPYLCLIKVKDTSITSCTINEKTKFIYQSAFSGCSSLTSIVIPNSVTNIGEDAFEGCSNLTSVTIPNSVTSIGEDAFNYCDKLSNVYYEGIIEDWCNIIFSTADYNMGSNPMSYASHFYMRNSNNEWEEVTSIEIPNTIIKIGEYQFYGFSNVTSITMPNSVTSIGKYAFFGCRNLTSIVIPNSVTSIGDSAFSGCSSLTSIVIPDSVTSIGDFAFNYCDKLSNVYYEGSIEDWNNIDYVGSNNTALDSATRYYYTETEPAEDGNYWHYVDGVITKWESNVQNPDHTHKYSTEWTIDKEATCTEVGSKSHHCLGCEEKTDITEIPLASHSYGSWATTKEPTEETTGLKERECSVCHNKETEIVPKLEHTHKYSTEWTIDKEATCTEVGSKSHHCLGCEEKTDITEIPLASHSYGSWIKTKEPTEETTGIKERECSVCHHKETEIIPKLDHTHKYSTEWTIDKEATCTEVGSKSHHCLGCDEKTDITEIPLIEHSFNTTWSSNTKYHYHNCENCDAVDCEIAHTFENNICSICQYEKKPESLEYKLNDDGDGYIVTGKGTMTGEELIIPSTYNGIPVIEIGQDTFKECQDFKKIIIEEGIETLGDAAFMMASVDSIKVPKTVTNFGLSSLLIAQGDIYFQCSLEEYINIFSKYISDDFDMSSMENGAPDFFLKNPMFMMAGSKIESGMNYNLFIDNLNYIDFANPIDTVEISGISNRKICLAGAAIQTIIIKDEIERIYPLAFSYCVNLKSITFPNSVKSIGDFAFAYCSSLTSIEIPNSVTSIGSSAFSGCSNLVNATIPTTALSYIPKDKLQEVIITEGESLGDYVFHNCSDLRSITIPNSVTSIGQNAFYGCSSLTSIEIPNSVTSIGEEAFYNCSSLTSITIGNSVTRIERYAFISCSALTNVYYEGTIEDWCNIIFSRADYNMGSNPMRYASHFYLRNGKNEWEEVTSIEIPNGVTEIGYLQFYGFSNVTSITIPDSVISIDEYAFYGCSSLQYNEYDNGLYLGNEENPYLCLKTAKDTSIISFTINEKTKLIHSSAFSGCSSLTSITIPNSITSIGSYAFSGCSSLTNITIGNSVTIIEYYAFSGCSGLTSVVIPDSVTIIEYYAFSGCSGLTSVVIPDSVTSIGSYAFYGCSSLTNVYYEGSIEDWCNITFSIWTSNPMNEASYFYIRNSNNEWEEVTSIEIPNTITEIGKDQFYGFSNVTSIIIPDSVTSIGTEAFSNCSNLHYNEYDNGLYLGNEENPYLCFIKVKDTSITSCTINEKTKFIYSDAFSRCSSLTSIVIPNSVTSIGSYAFSGCSGLTSVVIPDSVTIIEYYAFSGCSGLTSVVIPDSVTSIGNSAFDGCSSLTSITIPNSVTSIGSYAFYNCISLTSIVIPNSVTIIGSSAFSGCRNLHYNEYDNGLYIGNKENPYLWLIEAKDTSITSCTINEKTKFIYQSSFSGCSSLTSIVIPNNVTSIGAYAFEDCSSLTNVYYEGTSSNWNNIEIDYLNTSLTSATRYYYSETKPTESGNYWHYVNGVPTKW